MVCTAHRTGAFCDEAHVEDLRRPELLKFGIDFLKNWEDVDAMVFENLATTLRGSENLVYPMFKKGIVFCCSVDKGKVLNEFLRRLNLKFKKIIFVDDQIKNLVAMERIAIENRISYLGIEYTKIRSLPALRITFEEMQKRLDLFAENGYWISDEEFYS